MTTQQQKKVGLSTSPAHSITMMGFVQGFGAAAFAESATIPLDTLKVPPTRIKLCTDTE
jgi:hypothetical protein